MTIPKKYYFDSALEKEEFDKIFYTSWIFIGMDDELKNHNDFLTIDIFSNSIVIQNFKGEISAFQNVCAHRFKRIQTEAFGNRNFSCKYHGWTYNAEGKATGVPQKQTFDSEKLACVKLKKYKVESCGKFVFINLNQDDTETLSDFLGSFYNELIDLSNHIGNQISKQDIVHQCNWKLLVENVLEGYHCPLIHQQTLIQSGYCTITADDVFFENRHSKFNLPKQENNFNSKKSKLKFLSNRTLKHDSFKHFYIFPTLLISSTEGYFFYVGNLLPTNSQTTNLRTRFYEPKFNNESENEKPFLQKAFYDAGVEAAVTVLLEDKEMVESCQKGILEVSLLEGILSNQEEIRLKKFHEVYINQMTKKDE